jgi:hypothetical protein
LKLILIKPLVPLLKESTSREQSCTTVSYNRTARL